MGDDQIEIYRSKRPFNRGGNWRWRYIAAGNHTVLATGAEGYRDLTDLTISLTRVLGTSPIGPDMLISSFFTIVRADGRSLEVWVRR